MKNQYPVDDKYPAISPSGKPVWAIKGGFLMAQPRHVFTNEPNWSPEEKEFREDRQKFHKLNPDKTIGLMDMWRLGRERGRKESNELHSLIQKSLFYKE